MNNRTEQHPMALATGRFRHPHAKPVLARNRPARQRRIGETLSADVVADILANGADRIVSVFVNARPEADAEGETWYNVARWHAEQLAHRAAAAGRPLSVAQCAGILAAVSPRRGWGENLEVAYRIVADGSTAEVGIFDDMADKVDRILNGASWREVLGGRKVRSFAANIEQPDTAGPVTIDRHAVSILAGRPLTDAEASDVLERIGGYQVAAGIYRTVARRAGLLPQQLQAITWCEWRHIHERAERFDRADLAAF